MKAHKVRQVAIANALQVTEAYVSERVNGKRALDTDDVDALAKLTGTTGKNLMIELARLAKEDIKVNALSGEERQRIMDAKIDGGFALAASDDPNKRIEAETPDD
ncbi:helix-turn-helix domain-containing protein [Bifidobacterium pullorum]|nr:helix-turn-helix transcriptional regulator [Bifidobacterium pullorum]